MRRTKCATCVCVDEMHFEIVQGGAQNMNRFVGGYTHTQRERNIHLSICVISTKHNKHIKFINVLLMLLESVNAIRKI